MVSDIHEHPGHYAVLAVWFSLGLILLTLGRFNHTIQSQVLVLIALGYLVWGLVHHYLLHDLHVKIVLEYILFAALVMILVGGILA